MIIFPTYKLIFLKQINTNSFYGLYKKAKIYRALYFIIKKRYRGNQFILINSISFIFKLLTYFFFIPITLGSLETCSSKIFSLDSACFSF